MSTTLYPFSGNEQKSMIFTPMLDGEVYNCQTKWNIAAQRGISILLTTQEIAC